MRTTITLDADTRALIERAMRDRGLSFRDAVNQAIRAGLGSRPGKPVAYTRARPMGPAHIDLTKALQLAGALEGQALIQRLDEGR